jgi:hypothetical protein
VFSVRYELNSIGNLCICQYICNFYHGCIRPSGASMLSVFIFLSLMMVPQITETCRVEN